MRPAPRLVCALGAALILGPACELTDGIYHAGSGEVHGRLVGADGQPVAGAQVNWVGAEFDSAGAKSDAAGHFLLAGVPAGRQELMIRAPARSLGLREAVMVVGGRTSDVGAIELHQAPPLALTVNDPDLGIGGVAVRLAEVPGLEAITDTSGHAELACIPRSGCYTFKAAAGPPGFDFETDPVCPETDYDWANVPPLTPKQNGSLLHAQVYNAYITLQKLLDDLTDCDSGCLVPEFWRQPGPPCPFPTGDRHETDTRLSNLETMVAKLTNLDRFSEGAWSKLACPAPGAWGSACIQGRCRPASPAGAGSAGVARSGIGPKGCFPLAAESIVTIGGDSQSVAECLGIEPPPAGGPEIYLFVALVVPAWPTAAVVTTDGQGYDIFIEADLPLDPQSRGYREENYVWALVRLDPPAGGPAEPTFHAYLGWIDPVQ